MNSLQADLARATIDARRAEASRRRLAAEAAAPRSGGAAGRSAPPRPAGDGHAVAAPDSAHPARPPREPAVLDALLALVAERVAEHGTATEARVLELLSAAVHRTHPGAAAALVDWKGSEVARQRAFGLAHGVVLDDLGPGARSALLDRILGTDLALAG